ncbi:MAG: type II toxin-antitoxin system VapC family toxin [Pyrinomonadaceae bacterium]|nr:type II toxin-antitoxin system VapC family toxin [Pyrinomonadaceae bacterium]
MKLLLDTHTFLWFIAGDTNLSITAQDLINDAANIKFVSTASLWETAIKVSTGKLNLSASFDDLFPTQIESNGFELLQIKISHVSFISKLPFHRDPFDRLLIAQAIEEKMEIVSIDKVFDNYSVSRLW